MHSTEELGSSGDMATGNEDTQSLCSDDEDALREAAGGGGTDNDEKTHAPEHTGSYTVRHRARFDLGY